MKVRKPRRKADGSYEVSVQCPCCGSCKCEINSVSQKMHCWSCSYGSSGGLVSLDKGTLLLSASSLGSSPTPAPLSNGTPSDLTQDFPIFALQECLRRKQEPQWLIRRYGVRWSYERGRLWFPTGTSGGVLRSVLSWEEPKTICVPGTQGKGLIGEHLLEQGSPDLKSGSSTPDQVVPATSPAPLRLVLVEGDWKCVSIPLPWTGIGLQGVQLTEYQRFKILQSSPASIVVMLDAGWWKAGQRIVEDLLPYRAVRVDLPVRSGGPDDIPRAQLVKLLLSTERSST